MTPTDFTSKKSGRVIKTLQGYWAFVPNPLPPELNLTWELVSEISAADRALSELAGAASILPNPHLLINPFMRREAVLSSRIEGTQASLSDLFFFEASQPGTKSTLDVREVSNYVKALEFGLARLEELPLSTRLFREMHELLMSNVRGDLFTPGELRRSQNWIGVPGCTLNEATYVPPPVEEMQNALSDLEKFLHAPSPLPPLVRLGLVHYQFEAIHPFLDGNGRIGRLLITLLLCAEGLLPQPLLYLSAYFEMNRPEYYQRLLDVSRYGKWNEWLTFFLRGVTEESHDAIKRSRKLLDLQQTYRNTLHDARSTALTFQLLDSLFSNPAVRISQVTSLLNTTPRTAQLTIDKLVKLGIVSESTGQARNRVYAAQEIIRVIEKENS